jgi:hypothetical protein
MYVCFHDHCQLYLARLQFQMPSFVSLTRAMSVWIVSPLSLILEYLCFRLESWRHLGILWRLKRNAVFPLPLGWQVVNLQPSKDLDEWLVLKPTKFNIQGEVDIGGWLESWWEQVNELTKH